MTTYSVDLDGDDEPALWRLEAGDDWGESIASLYSGHTAVTSGHVPDRGVVFRAAAAVLAPDVKVAEAINAATFDPGRYVKRLRDADGHYEALHRWQARAVQHALRAHVEEATP